VLRISDLVRVRQDEANLLQDVAGGQHDGIVPFSVAGVHAAEQVER